MNLALRGISHNLGEEADSTFTHDLHKGIYFDYIMANPPFNLKGWYDENLKNDSRWADYVTPPESNANYAWILHMLSHLRANKGVAGFLLANGALGDSDTVDIRRELIKNDKVEAIIILPRELFITTDISVTLWILNQNKKGGEYHGRTLRNRENEILFMDLRTWTENPVKNEGKKKVFLSDEQIQRAADIYHTWQNEGTDGANYAVPELYRSVNKDLIKEQGWSLVPSKYIEFIDHDLDIDFNAEMSRIQAEMRDVLAQESKTVKVILKRNKLRDIRFHELRHSCASLLLAKGIPMKMIQDWLGHSDMSTTAKIYSHIDSTSKKETAQAIGELLG